MASTNFTDKVTMVPADWANDVNRIVYQVFGNAQNASDVLAALGLSAAATMDPNAVIITGGTIDGVNIGGAVPAIQVNATNMKVLTNPVGATDVVNLGYMQTYTAQQIGNAISTLTATLGSMAYQNSNNVKITAGTIDNVEIGLGGPAAGVFTTLQVSNPPAQAQDVVTLGFMLAHYDTVFATFGGMATQSPAAVVITGGNIDGVNIGSVTPPNGVFNTLYVNQLPVAPAQVANKQYVDTAVAVVGANLGTMSTQNANAIAVTGGRIDGTPIGAGTPSTGAFSNLTIIGTQAVVNANFNSSTSNFGGINVNEGGVSKITMYAYGENNGANSNTSVLASANPLAIQQGTASLSMTTSSISANVALSLVTGATSGYGPNQAMSLVLGDQAAYAGGIKLLDGATTTNYGTITYQKSNLQLEINSPQTVALNATGAGAVLLAGGTGDVTVGTVVADPTTYDVNKLTVNGGVYSKQGVVASLFRTTHGALGNVAGTVAVPSNTNGAFTMTLTGNTTLNLTTADNRYAAGVGQFRKIEMLITIGTAGSTFAINGVTWFNAVAPNFAGKAASSVQLVTLYSPNNGATWYGSTT
jgi:hypothetical protein